MNEVTLEISCTKCSKPFVRSTNTRSKVCKECMKAYHQAKYQTNKTAIKVRVIDYKHHKREIVRSAKKRPCFDCDGRYHYVVMDFDHVRGIKEFEMYTAWTGGKSESLIRKEMAKCDVVCANCHRMRTWLRDRGVPVTEGLKATLTALEIQYGIV